MSVAHTPSGELVSVLPLGAALQAFKTTAILKAAQLELVKIVLPTGRSIREHRVDGEVTLLCIEGYITLSTPTFEKEMRAGDLIHLGRNVPHALTARFDASALLTICLPQRDPVA